MDWKTYYHPDGTTDWLKTAVKRIITYRLESYDEAVCVESIAAQRTQRLYYAKTMLRLVHVPWSGKVGADVLSQGTIIRRNEEGLPVDGGKKLRVPLHYGKSPIESLEEVDTLLCKSLEALELALGRDRVQREIGAYYG